jgi:hypothetical protein
MRLFVYPLILICFVLVIFAQISMPLISKHYESRVLPVHKTLYLSREINDEEMFCIIDASLEWSEVTNGQVIFDVKRLPQKNFDKENAIVIFNVDPDFPDIILMDGTRGPVTLGYYDHSYGLSYIALVDNRLDDNNYEEVVLHELGHSIGLEHSGGADGIGTLMYPNVDEGSYHVTDKDLKQLCELYHCDASQFHGK